MNILPAALGGMTQAEARVDGVAARVASAHTVDLSREMVNLLQARSDFEVNARMVHVAGEMGKQLLDVLG